MTESDESLESPDGIAPEPEETVVLADVLHKRGPLPKSELLSTFIDVLRDLERAHGDGLLHRDISPQRIVLIDGVWKLVEYGLDTVGTVRYMSPERCQGKPTDARYDIY